MVDFSDIIDQGVIRDLLDNPVAVNYSQAFPFRTASAFPVVSNIEKPSSAARGYPKVGISQSSRSANFLKYC